MSSPSQSPRPRDLSSSRFPAPHAASPSPSPLASPPPASPSPFASPDDEPPADDIADGNDGNGADDDEYGHAAAQDLPLTMTASTVLLNLPRDATAALATAGRFAKDKVIVRFKPVGSAPPLSAAGGADVRRKITATQKFEVVVAFVRRALKVQESESVFLYINSSFAPALDEVVGNLHQCFKDSHDQLNVSYSLTPAFG
ncbi:Ubiquitin-like protein [Sporothrix eucalyptigena]|uniref:Ubiquitin-like protein ATG12 n=1 Tax=Sporothrix eucalyptigena TaxID=1812306 RepID=A0ABP0B718_9PEZI